MSDEIDSFIVRCGGCGRVNRVRLRMGPICGHCKRSLASDIGDLVMAAAECRRRELEELGVLPSPIEAAAKSREKLN